MQAAVPAPRNFTVAVGGTSVALNPTIMMIPATSQEMNKNWRRGTFCQQQDETEELCRRLSQGKIRSISSRTSRPSLLTILPLPSLIASSP